RRHVGQRAGDDFLRLSQTCGERDFALRLNQPRQTEIENLQSALGCEAQIAWFQVAVNYAFLVGGSQSLRQLDSEGNDLRLWQCTWGQLGVESDPRDVRGDQEIHPVIVTELVDGC